MQLSDIREELKLAWKAFFFYGRGFEYLSMRYAVAPKILSHSEPLEKPETRKDMSMHILFGSRDFLMALWSLASFYRVMSERGELVVHSDGTLDERHRGIIRRLFPSARIESADEFMALHGSALDQYPTLKEFRKSYPRFQSKKLIDQFVLSGKSVRLLLDSDLLWFREPRELVESIRNGVPRPFMMTNQDARIHVEFKDGTQTSDAVAHANSGIVLYRKEQFSFSEMEAYVGKTDYLGKKFTDQACFASVLKPDLLPESTYLIKGTITDSTILRHYTSPQRAKFFFYGLNLIWKDILK